MWTFQRRRVNWRWIDGEVQTFSYNAWDYKQPDNLRGKEYCAYYDQVAERWYDGKCDEVHGAYVCQDTNGKSELSTCSTNHMHF